MKTEAEIKELVHRLENAQLTKGKSPSRSIQIRTLQWVLGYFDHEVYATTN